MRFWTWTAVSMLWAVSAAAEVEPAPGRTLQGWYELGGSVMHALAFCSVLVVAVSLERMWALRRARIVPGELVDALRSSGRAAAEGDGSNALARIVQAGQRARTRGAAGAEDAVLRAGSSEVGRMQRHLPLLAALGNLATMLGLLGTVLGMIEAFELIAHEGTGDARIVAGGIFEALVTTAVGLAIGISALSAHAFFRRRVDAFSLELEELASEVFEPSTARVEEGGSEAMVAEFASQQS